MNSGQAHSEPDRRFSVAPMMDATDRHCRYFLRLISRRALLYSEMITSAAIVHGDRARLLDFDPREHPLALQIGGSEPAQMAAAAVIGEEFGYDEVNINVGCPSPRVQKGSFGACLMAEPERVAECLGAMRERVRIPVTVKCRIGVDDRDRYEDLAAFTEAIAGAGCRSIVVHARKALLKGLSPKQNRQAPALDYGRVYQLKADYPSLEIIINGGITSLDQAAAHLGHVDGVMLGREAYHNPYLLAAVDARFYADPRPALDRKAVAEAMIPYLEQQAAAGVRPSHITRHLMGLYLGQPAARVWRRTLGEQSRGPGSGGDILRAALAAMHEAAARAA